MSSLNDIKTFIKSNPALDRWKYQLFAPPDSVATEGHKIAENGKMASLG